ncbi:MAG: PDZ domain-containing protein [Acidobacteriota bacterium]|nr:PDZ domain-containing protein [Acidobacteriota bacterium]
MKRSDQLSSLASLVAIASALLMVPAVRAQAVLSPDPPGGIFAFSPALAGGSFLGVGVAEVTPERARDLKLREEYGVEITRLEDDSPAAKAGLKSGDVILEYQGQRVEGLTQFGRLVRETPAGRTVKLVISRGGATQTVQATVASRKGMVSHEGNLAFAMPSMPDIQIDMPRVFTALNSSMLGVEAESLGKQLAEFFGVKDGVLVRSVVKGSAAEAAGIKAGDVITKVDQTPVAAVSDLSSAVRSSRSKRTFPVQIMREHHETTVTVTIDEDRSGRQSLPRTRVVRGGAVRM